MFDMKDSKEVLEGSVQINDVSDEALQAMVDFIYTQENRPMKEIQLEDTEVVQDLLVLSNKYNLNYLSEKMIPKFIPNIEVDNCVDSYFFGFMHEYESIKLVAFHTILSVRNRPETEEKLKRFSKSFPKEYDNLKNKIQNFDYSENDDFGLNYFSKKQLGYKNCVEAFFFGEFYKCDFLALKAKIVVAHHWERIQTEKLRLKPISEIFSPFLMWFKKDFEKQIQDYRFTPNEVDKDDLQLPLIKTIKGGNNFTERKQIRCALANKRVMKVSPELRQIIGVETATIGELVQLFWTYMKKHKIAKNAYTEHKTRIFNMLRPKINKVLLDRLWSLWGFSPDDKLAKYLSDADMAHFGNDSN